MTKSKNVSKYYTPWQIVRVQAKRLKTPEEKTELALDYLADNLTYPNYERVYNWVEGLAKGYTGKNPQAVKYLEEILEALKLVRKEINRIEDYPEPKLSEYSQDILILLYKDLYRRADEWTKDFYFNEELLKYLELLEQHIRGGIIKPTELFRIRQKIALQLHEKPKHKFLF